MSGQYPIDPTLRLYLLGLLADEQKMQEIEEKILIDESFSDEMSISEELLIEEYLEGSLAPVDRTAFSNVLRMSADLQERVRLVAGLKKIAADEAPVVVTGRKTGSFFSFLRIPVIRYAGAFGVLALIGFFIWQSNTESDIVSDGLDKFRLAYSGKRTALSRSSFDLPYGPVIVTRGEQSSGATNEIAFAAAKATIADAAIRNAGDVRTLRAESLVAIAEKRFNDAIAKLEKANSIQASNPDVLNDLGSAHFEKAGASSSEQSRNDLAAALVYLDKARAFSPQMRAAAFNRALVLERLNETTAAIEAWNYYLSLDNSSEWSKEAKTRLEALILLRQ